MYDIIGDIHGHANELKALLRKMGYEPAGDSFQHENNKVIFVGDYIDRGPQIPETLKIVKAMVDNGDAIALMGNHEYNAICYHTYNHSGKPLRKHSPKNDDQHKETLDQFVGRNDLQDYIDWFKTLPLFFEHDNFRAVHACWNSDDIEFLKASLGGNKLMQDHFIEAHSGNTRLFNALEVTLKGKELKLPEGYTFLDKDKHVRDSIRIRWWEDSTNTTFKAYSILEEVVLPEMRVTVDGSADFYQPSDKPVFFGHYWLDSQPRLYRENVCCLDYSVAKGGKLVAYRYKGEPALSPSGFCW